MLPGQHWRRPRVWRDLPGSDVHRSGDGGAAGRQLPARRPGRLPAQWGLPGLFGHPEL
ncbi:hypothetical protein NKG94_04840 [Micromonospora sp. M12]